MFLILEVEGLESNWEIGFRFRFVSCVRAGRGEAVWASERRFDRAARAVVRDFRCSCSSGGRNHAGWVVREKC